MNDLDLNLQSEEESGTDGEELEQISAEEFAYQKSLSNIKNN